MKVALKLKTSPRRDSSSKGVLRTDIAWLVNPLYPLNKEG